MMLHVACSVSFMLLQETAITKHRIQQDRVLDVLALMHERLIYVVEGHS